MRISLGALFVISCTLAVMSLLSILIASLLGSPHCAAMCSGFAGIAAHSPRPRYSQLSYHLGRLVTYLSLGVIAGYLGQMIDRFGYMLGISKIAAILTGIFMIVTSLSMLSGKTLGLLSWIPIRWLHFPSRFMPTASMHSRFSAFFLGLFSTLLPCGWLYTYVALAAASASSSFGLLIMLFFWLGTLPVLLTVGSISHLLSASLRKYVPTLVAILMLCAGFFALTGHLVTFTAEPNKPLICLP